MISMLLPILTPKYVVRREERGLAVATSPRLVINDADIRAPETFSCIHDPSDQKHHSNSNQRLLPKVSGASKLNSGGQNSPSKKPSKQAQQQRSGRKPLAR